MVQYIEFQKEAEYVMVTSEGQTEIQSIQIVGEVDEADLTGSGQYILLNEENEKIMVRTADSVNCSLPVSFEGSTVVSSEELVSQPFV